MSNLRTFDLNLLVAFDVLMRELNVTRAAEQMFITQSAMSHILHRLRQQLDDPLLIKTPTGMKPTARALNLIEPVRATLLQMEQLIQPPPAFEAASSRRRFVIAATDHIEFLLIPALFERIRSLAPGVDIHVIRTETAFPLTPMEDGDIDVVVGFDAVIKPPAHLHCQKLFTEQVVAVVEKSHPVLQQDMSLAEFIAVPQLMISRTGDNTGIIDEKLDELGLKRRIQLIVPHFLSAPLIVAHTDLLLTLPKRIAERFTALAPLAILPVPPELKLPDYTVSMIWHPLRDREPAHLWLREQIAAIGQNISAE